MDLYLGKHPSLDRSKIGVDRENARGNMTLVSVRPPPVAIGGAAPPDRAPRPRTSTRRLGAREQLAHSVDTALCSQAAASLAAHRRTRVPVWWRVRTLRKGSARACPPCGPGIRGHISPRAFAVGRSYPPYLLVLMVVRLVSDCRQFHVPAGRVSKGCRQSAEAQRRSHQQACQRRRRRRPQRHRIGRSSSLPGVDQTSRLRRTSRPRPRPSRSFSAPGPASASSRWTERLWASTTGRR